MNMKFPLFIAALSMMASLNVLAASTLAREGMITTDDYATFLNTPEGEGGETSSFLEIEGAMHRQDCYEEKMAEEAGASCLMRMGEPGNYFYACTEGTSSTPLHFISTLDAELYCRWSNTALAPAAPQSSERDPLLKTNITTFHIQIAHEGTQGTSLHQAMGEEKTVEPFISEILEEIIGVVLAGGVLGGNNLHARADERVRTHTDQGFNNASHPTNTTYRLTDFGWEEGKRHPKENGGSISNSFRPIDRFNNENQPTFVPEALLSSNTRDPFTEVIRNHSRSDGITKKIASYQQRLDAPAIPLREEEREMLKNLINVLNAAKERQESMITHLLTNPSSLPESSKLRLVETLSTMEKINERPNKIELLAEKLEQDYKNLSDYQASAQQRQSEIDAQPAPIDIPDPRLTSIEHLNHAITHQQDLINARVTMASLLRPPYEALDEATSKTLSTHKWNVIRYEAEAQRHESLAKVALDNSDFSVPYLRRAAASFEQVALEAQKPNPSQQVIDWFTQSASLYKGAAKAKAEGLNDKALYLNNAGGTLFLAATEAQKPNPSQQVINWFTQSASFYQKAEKAEAEGLNDKAVYLNNAGGAFFELAREALKPTPSPQSIKWYTESARLHQQAAEAKAEGLNDKALYLNNAGSAFFELALEEQKPTPSPQSIKWYTESARLHQQAAEAKAEGLNDKALYLNNAGSAFFELAREAQKPNPSQHIIDWFTESASLHQQAEVERAKGLDRKAVYLNNAGSAFFAAAKEGQKENFDQHIINWFTKSANLHQQAEEAEAEGLNDKAAHLNNAGEAHFLAAREAQKPTPNQQRIQELFSTAGENERQAAQQDPICTIS